MKLSCVLFICSIFFGWAAISSADQMVADDQVVQGSLCIGADCIDGEPFAFDTLRLKGEDIRLHFDDTSTSAGFPSNDWRLIINDSTGGGENFFGIQDATAGEMVFKAGAGSSGGVAIGYGSVAAVNTVSVGSAGNERRLTNVADGVDATDAVNLRQLEAMEANFLDELQPIQHQLNELSDRVRAIGALSVAMTSILPNHRAENDTQVALGVGTYRDNYAFAAGVFHYVNNNVLVNGAVSSSSDLNETAGRAGVTFGW